MTKAALLALALCAGCGGASVAVTLLSSPIADEDPFAGVSALELRLTRAGVTSYERAPLPRDRVLRLARPPAGATLEIAALDSSGVVAAGRSAPFAAAQKSASVYVARLDHFAATPSPRPDASARFLAAAARELDGRVLFVGGATRGSPGAPDAASLSALVDRYDPASGAFSSVAAGGLEPRVYHALAVTADGALVAGGLGKFAALDDVFLLGSGVVARLPSPRYAAAATVLADGRSVLLAGGYSAPGTLAGDALVIGKSGVLRSVALPSPRAFAAATLLADGRVLVSGGVDAGGVRADALVYSPADDSFVSVAMIAPRVGHSATRVGSDVVVFGGNDGRASVPAPERYDGARGTFVALAPFALVGRERHAGVTLVDGSALVAGGEESPQKGAVPSPLGTVLRFVPDGGNGTLSTLPLSAATRADANLVSLSDGSVLYAGGAISDPRMLAGGAELFVPCFDACRAQHP